MCRVNPKKIRHPKNFPDCYFEPNSRWNSTYRILINRIPIYPIADGVLSVEKQPVDYIMDIFKSKEYSLYKHRKRYPNVNDLHMFNYNYINKI